MVRMKRTKYPPRVVPAQFPLKPSIIVPEDQRQDCWIFDVDGTLIDVTAVRHWVTTPGMERNFDKFHRESTGCPVIEQTRELWHSVPKGTARIVVTARQAKYYHYTLWHLLLEGINPDDMYMRGWTDQRPDDVVKEDILAIIKQRYNPIMAVDDNPSVIEVWKRNGIPTITIPGWID